MEEKKMRLDRFLTETIKVSRKAGKEYIRSGRISVNGLAADRPEIKIDPKLDVICVDGNTVSYQEYYYYMLNKPKGVITAARDRNHKTVMELFEGFPGKDLEPVGRLDKDTVGLLLVTNDGALTHRLLSPKNHVPKQYIALVDGSVKEEHVMGFKEGIVIDEDFTALPAKLEVLQKSEDSSLCRVTVYEGKFHQVKRMFEAFGLHVLELKRISMGPLVLDESLEEGSCRPLTEEEVKLLKRKES